MDIRVQACCITPSPPPSLPGNGWDTAVDGATGVLEQVSELVDHSISQHDPHILMIVSTSSLGCMPSPTPFKLDTRAL